jgi:hypothetical protein
MDTKQCRIIFNDALKEGEISKEKPYFSAVSLTK